MTDARRAALIGPVVAGLLSVIVTWFAWGSVNPIPVVSDEQSYALQSRIFASFHWKASAPPIADFFEQSHVLVDPAVASKFPPGHALILAIGTLLGSPLIASLLLTFVTGALLYALTRRVTHAVIATFAVAIWLSDPINLRFRPSFFSELTTGLLWLASLWALFEWRKTRDRRWLFALAAAIGWGAITRPLTMLGFAVPIGVVVIRDVMRAKGWRDFALAAGIGIIILGILPFWSARTTGDWRLSPVTLYQRDYLPFDHPGFGVDTTTPAKTLNPVNQATYAEFYREHAAHTPGNLPIIIWDRLRLLAISEWSGWRLVIVPFVIIGLFAMTTELWFALVCSGALFVAYLSYGHFSEWTLYYFEGIPILSVIAAVGLFKAFETMVKRQIRSHLPPNAGDVQLAAIGGGPFSVPSLILIALVALIARESWVWRGNHRTNALYYTNFNAMVDALPKNPTVIFVHYTPRLQPHPTIVQNSPELENEPIWIVNDLGARDRELMRYTGPRVPIYFFEESGKFELARDLIR